MRPLIVAIALLASSAAQAQFGGYPTRPPLQFQINGTAQAGGVTTVNAPTGSTFSGGVLTLGGGGGNGTVTSVACGTGLTGGTFTTSGTCAIDSTVVATLSGTQTISGTKTFSAAPVFGAGATATGAASFDLSGSSGTFKFPGGSVTGAGNITSTAGAITAQTTVGANQGLKNNGSGTATQGAGTYQVNFSTTGYEQVITLTGNVTSVPLHSSATATGRLGGYMILTFVQDATGSRTVTGWDSSFKFLPSTYEGTNHVAPTLTTTPTARDTFVFVSDGTNWVEVHRNLNN